MKIGLNYAPIRRADQAKAAALADRLGYSSLWYGEHVALPYDFDPSRYPGEQMTFDPDSIILDPFTLLAHTAGITEHVRLGTGIAILPLHDPLLTARTLVTLDMVSQGRLDLGVGVGWCVDEFDFLGRDFAKRARSSTSSWRCSTCSGLSPVPSTTAGTSTSARSASGRSRCSGRASRCTSAARAPCRCAVPARYDGGTAWPTRRRTQHARWPRSSGSGRRPARPMLRSSSAS